MQIRETDKEAEGKVKIDHGVDEQSTKTEMAHEPKNTQLNFVLYLGRVSVNLWEYTNECMHALTFGQCMAKYYTTGLT